MIKSSSRRRISRTENIVGLEPLYNYMTVKVKKRTIVAQVFAFTLLLVLISHSHICVLIFRFVIFRFVSEVSREVLR